MSNTVKIKNKKKKSEVKVNYKLWAIVFGVFIALIVGLSIWASFHWGVGMGTIGVRPVTPENADAAATEAAAENAAQFSTDGTMVVTPEQLEQMGISPEDLQEQGAAEDAAAADQAAGDANAEETAPEEADAANE